MKDFQKQKVYTWEDEVVGPRCSRQISFENAQAFVDGVWMSLGLLYPPRVEALPKQNKTKWATGNRVKVQLHSTKPTPAWVILHELAHTLTCTCDGDSDRHGPDFVGMYMKLLDKVENLPLSLTMYSLQNKDIKYNIGAQPRFTVT